MKVEKGKCFLDLKRKVEYSVAKRFLKLELDSVFYQTEVVQSIKIGEVGRKIKHFLRRLVNQPKSPPNPSTFSLLSSSHLAIQQELCQEKLIFQVGKFVSERGGIF